MTEKEFLHYAHPIDPAMREQVMAHLRAIETQHNVTILFACESGSRGWGFASPHSDYDVRYKKHLYVLRPLLAARWIRSLPGVQTMRFALPSAGHAPLDALLFDTVLQHDQQAQEVQPC